jgi:hypothetical protein
MRVRTYLGLTRPPQVRAGARQCTRIWRTGDNVGDSY